MELQQIGVGHPAVKQVLDVQNNTAPNRRRLFVAEGLWANNIVLNARLPIDTFFWCPEAIYSDEAKKRSEELAQCARRAYRVSEKTLARMSDQGNPDGLISLLHMPQWQRDDITLGSSALVLVSDGIEIPGNLGTLIRTLDACGADLLVMTNRRTRMSHPKVLRGSQGMSVWVPHIEFEQVNDAMDWLDAHDFHVYLADTDNCINYRSANYAGRTAIVVGSERYGVSKPWYSRGYQRIGIPMLGHADSLNVSVSASILLYEARSRKDRW